MTGSLLETKLYVPKPRRRPIVRPRLSERLDEGVESKLTLVSAPAGFGKTTLIAEWIARSSHQRSTAWLSLDQADSEAGRFWTYLIAALQTVVPEVGSHALTLLRESQPLSMDTILASLLNDLGSAAKDVVLVLDDFHLVEGHEIEDGMEFFLEHLPPRTHVVIASRADPGLRLSRLRARGELVEIRATDLRFKTDEAASYLNEAMGLSLTPAQVAALETRTEGWIAALQLAGLSMQGRDDVSRFIEGFTGDDRYIVDYLAEEVLHRQSEQVRRFLLDTSILTRLTGALCDAVTDGTGGKAMLETLDRGNLFLIPLDDRRQWYRYHHLFGDVLQARLLAEDPGRVPELHRRATQWYEDAGERPEAIRHALAGQDFTRAAELIELAMTAANRDRQEATLRRWLEALPDEVIRARPVLSNGVAGTILTRSETQGVEARLQDAERWLTAAAGVGASGDPVSGMVVSDQEAFRRLPGTVAIHRAGLARLLGDVDGTISHARRALSLFDDDDDLGQASASILLALAYWTNADLEAAIGVYADAMPRFERVGYLSDVVSLAIALADMRIAQGRLRDAMRAYDRGLDLARGQRDGVLLRGAADMHVGISEILRERNDLAGAAEHLHRSAELGEENGLPQHPYRSRVAAALLRYAEGNLTGAIELLVDAERRYVTDFLPPVRPVAAVKARLLIAQGDLSGAWTWAREQAVSVEDDPTYVREYEHLTLARLMLAQTHRDRPKGELTSVLRFLDRLRDAAESGGRSGALIDILVVQTLAHEAAGDRASALAALRQAIELGDPEGYVRIFTDEGPAMAALLKLAARQPSASDGAARLLAASGTTSAPMPVTQSLIEPLSERELEVLRLLQSDLDGPDIARELSVSLATVRTHTRNVYAKLGVNNRRSAVRRGADLGLFAGSAKHSPTS